jgi:hypothetical protein
VLDMVVETGWGVGEVELVSTHPSRSLIDWSVPSSWAARADEYDGWSARMQSNAARSSRTESECEPSTPTS